MTMMMNKLISSKQDKLLKMLLQSLEDSVDLLNLLGLEKHPLGSPWKGNLITLTFLYNK